MKLVIELGPNFERTVSDLSAMGQNVKRAASRGLRKGVKFAAASVARFHLSGQSLKSRTGNLRRAVDGWMDSDIEGVVGVAAHSAVDNYKWILGGETKTITPKSGKFLAIPIGEGLTPSGVARYSSPRDVPNGFFFKGKSGGLFFGYRRGKTKRAKARALFIMVKSTTVKGSDALAKGVLDTQDKIAEMITDEMKDI